MSIVQNIKQKKIRKSIDRLLKKNDKTFRNLEDVKTVLLIVDADDKFLLTDLNLIEKFISEKVSKVDKIYFTTQRLSKNSEPQKDTIYLNKSVLKNPQLQTYSKSKYDISFLLTSKPDIEFQYLLAFIPSDLRVGPDFEESIADINFVIKGNDVKEYIDMIDKYLVKKH